MKNIILLIFSLPFFFLTAEAQPPTSLKVGYIFPLSGDFANYGTGAANAVKLAFEPSSNYSIVPFFEDNKTCTATDAVTAYRKLSSIDHVQAVVTFCTAAAKAILPIAKADSIALFQLTEPGVPEDSYMIKMMPLATPMIDILADIFIKKYKKMAILASTIEVNTSEAGNVPLFKKAFQQRIGEIVSIEEFPSETMDFRPIILKLKASAADAIIPFIWSPNQMATFLRQAEQLSLWKKKKLAGNFIFEMMLPDILKLYPQLKGMDGLESVNFKQTTSPNFIEDYTKHFNEAPPQFADYAFDATKMIQKCGLDRECLLRPFDGASGYNDFSADGRRKGVFVSKFLANGQFVAEEDRN